MPKKATGRRPVPDHFDRGLGRLRQWVDGFEAAGGTGPVDKDVLRQIQIWIAEERKAR